VVQIADILKEILKIFIYLKNGTFPIVHGKEA
jgi:hypothetical protein